MALSKRRDDNVVELLDRSAGKNGIGEDKKNEPKLPNTYYSNKQGFITLDPEATLVDLDEPPPDDEDYDYNFYKDKLLLFVRELPNNPKTPFKNRDDQNELSNQVESLIGFLSVGISNYHRWFRSDQKNNDELEEQRRNRKDVLRNVYKALSNPEKNYDSFKRFVNGLKAKANYYPTNDPFWCKLIGYMSYFTGCIGVYISAMTAPVGGLFGLIPSVPLVGYGLFKLSQGAKTERLGGQKKCLDKIENITKKFGLGSSGG